MFNFKSYNGLYVKWDDSGVFVSPYEDGGVSVYNPQGYFLTELNQETASALQDYIVYYHTDSVFVLSRFNSEESEVLAVFPNKPTVKDLINKVPFDRFFSSLTEPDLEELRRGGWFQNRDMNYRIEHKGVLK